MNEVRALRVLEHPNIIKLREIHEFKERVVLVLEFISGSSLLKYILARQTIPEQDAAFILKTLLTSLKAVHDRGIVHRNLKPENIYLNYSKNGTQLKLTDFGFSCSVQPQENSSWYITKNYCTK